MSVPAASSPGSDANGAETWVELLGVYGQSVGTVIAVVGLLIAAGAALVGLYAFAAATAPTDAFDFGRELNQLLQRAAWTKVDGSIVLWRDVLLVQIIVMALALLILTASALATLLHAQSGRAEAARRAYATLFGAAYLILAALISIPCIALASGYQNGRLGIFWLGFGVLWLLVMLSGLPIGVEVRVGARLHWRAMLWLIVAVALCAGLLSGAIDGSAALTVLVASGLVEVLRRAPTVIRMLRARLA